ncbi:MAG: ABC transporter permease [Candidatus Wallbacteria bacterium]|nr:ABC transporter permease [Candidatus Wallbacteria bacterium]
MMGETVARLTAAVDAGLAGSVRLVVDVVWLAWRALGAALTLRFDRTRFVAELDRSVVGALPLVLAAGLATGAVMVWQTVEGLARFGASVYAAKLVALSLVRELAPVLTGLLLAGRAGSAIAAELGSMTITEQLDAMRALALDPIRYLVAPRVLALAMGLPCLVLAFDFAGFAGGLLVGVLDKGIPLGAYLEATRSALLASDLEGGALKGAAFGLLIALIGCVNGLRTDPKRGASDVGRSTTGAVVAASVAILVADAALTRLLLGWVV